MTETIPELLAVCAEEVLGTMFFTPVLGRHPASEEQPHLGVRMCFLGGSAHAQHSDQAAPGGHLDVEVSKDGAQSIAASFLAMDEGSVPEHRVKDVLCELTNIICGNVMSNLATNSGFSLMSPEIIRGSGTEWPHAARFEESLELERGWLTVRLALVNS